MFDRYCDSTSIDKMALGHEVRILLRGLTKEERLELLGIMKFWKRFRLKELISVGIPKDIYYEFFNWYSQKHLSD